MCVPRGARTPLAMASSKQANVYYCILDDCASGYVATVVASCRGSAFEFGDTAVASAGCP